jgi:hypothetical protein
MTSMTPIDAVHAQQFEELFGVHQPSSSRPRARAQGDWPEPGRTQTS